MGDIRERNQELARVIYDLRILKEKVWQVSLNDKHTSFASVLTFKQEPSQTMDYLVALMYHLSNLGVHYISRKCLQQILSKSDHPPIKGWDTTLNKLGYDVHAQSSIKTYMTARNL